MDQKIAQYLNKDTGNAVDKCLEMLYNSLEKDIELMCKIFEEERSNKSPKPEVETPNNDKLTKVKKRVDLIIKTIADLNILDQGGTSYLGGGSCNDKN